MATGKKYYWMKLKESFMTSDTVDYFMSQPDGANYVVLYQMLCLKTINTEGRLERTIGEIIIPYDVEKIQRDCKWFSIDTVRIALDLYKSVGLIYVEENGTLVLANYGELVGSETDWKAQKKLQREKKKLQLAEHCEDEDDDCGHVHTDVHQNVHTDIRDKRLEIDNRDKDIDINNKKKRKHTFRKPTLEEVIEYAKSRNSNVDPKEFYEYFEAGEWIDSEGKPVISWKQKLITWESRRRKNGKPDARENYGDGGESKGEGDDWSKYYSAY